MSDDIPPLKPANDNPWYCLTTLHGEQPVDDPDEELAEKNRLAWNRWFATALSDDERASLVKNGFPGRQRAPFSPEEKSAFCRDFAVRTGREGELPPKPNVAPDFNFTHFDRNVDFRRFLFMRGANFSAATFSGYAIFVSATFREADFSSATFFGGASFDSATFSGYTIFVSATFSGVTNFRDVKFKGLTTFARTDFGNRVPDFRGATMHEVTEWHGVIWPRPPKNRDSAQAQVYAYERLKQEMERLKKYEDEQRFFRRELRARRGLSRLGSGEWFLNLAYQASSNYGQSIGLPLIWLFGLFAMGSVFYALHMTMPSRAALSLEAIPHAAAISFANLFPFVPVTHDIASANVVAGLSRPEKIIGVLQTLLGTPLLFLLGLALRNRFRMR